MDPQQLLDIKTLRERFLECKICTFEYDEEEHQPMIFPCLHGTCFSCAKKIVQEKGNLTCPVCRNTYDVHNNDVEKTFLKDFTRRDLLNFVQVHESSAIIYCDNCKDENKDNLAIHRCRVCAQFLCKDCSAAHQKIRATRSHGFIDLDEFKKQNFNYKDFSFEGLCEEHNTKLTLYCKNEECEMPLCMNCAILKHRDHNYAYLADVFNAKKEAIEKKLEDLFSITADRRNIVRHLEEEVRHLYDNIKTSEDNLERSFGKCSDVIENRLKEHKRVLVDLRDEKYKSINQQQSDIESIIDQTEQSCEFAQQALQYRNPSAFLLIERTISDRLQELIEILHDVHPHKTNYVVFEDGDMQSIIEDAVCKFGAILSTSAYLPRTEVVCFKVVQLPAPGLVQVKLFDSDGHHLVRENARVSIVIEDEMNNKRKIQLKSSYKSDMSCSSDSNDIPDDCEKIYEASIMPELPGQYKFKVYVYDMEIPEEYYIEVKEGIDGSGEESAMSKDGSHGHFFEDLKMKYLSCAICKHDFNEGEHFPRLLNCLHQVGDSCLRKHLLESEDHKLKCPTCEEEYDLDEGTLDKIPCNFTWRQLHDFIFAQEPEEHERSCNCESKKPFSHWCKECAEFMCDECKRAHKQLASTKGHVLLPLEDLSLPVNDLVKFCHMTPCGERDHKNQILPVYCYDCKVALCVLCVITHKRNRDVEHDIRNINDVYEEKVAETEGNMSMLQARLQTIEEIIARVQVEDQDIENATNKAKEDIANEFDEYEKKLRKRRQQLISSVETIKDEKREVLRQQLDDLGFHRKLIMQSLETSDLSLKFKDVPAFLLMEDVINERLRILTDKEKDKQPHTSSQMRFTLSKKDEECKRYFPAIGYIDSTSACITSSVINIPEVVTMDTEVEVTLDLFDSSGERANGITDAVCLKVISPNGQEEMIETDTLDTTQSLLYTWRPHVEGKHTLYASLKSKSENGGEQSNKVEVMVEKLTSDANGDVDGNNAEIETNVVSVTEDENTVQEKEKTVKAEAEKAAEKSTEDMAAEESNQEMQDQDEEMTETGGKKVTKDTLVDEDLPEKSKPDKTAEKNETNAETDETKEKEKEIQIEAETNINKAEPIPISEEKIEGTEKQIEVTTIDPVVEEEKKNNVTDTKEGRSEMEHTPLTKPTASKVETKEELLDTTGVVTNTDSTETKPEPVQKDVAPKEKVKDDHVKMKTTEKPVSTHAPVHNTTESPGHSENITLSPATEQNTTEKVNPAENTAATPTPAPSTEETPDPNENTVTTPSPVQNTTEKSPPPQNTTKKPPPAKNARVKSAPAKNTAPAQDTTVEPPLQNTTEKPHSSPKTVATPVSAQNATPIPSQAQSTTEKHVLTNDTTTTPPTQNTTKSAVASNKSTETPAQTQNTTSPAPAQSSTSTPTLAQNITQISVAVKNNSPTPDSAGSSEEKPASAQKTTSAPVPAQDTTPTPVQNTTSTPVPAEDNLPMPVKNTTSAPVSTQDTTPIPAPEQDTTPTPAPEQYATPTLAPEQDTTPTPAPEQDTTRTSAPEQDPTPIPAPKQDTTPTPAPEQDTKPTPAPEQDTTHTPAPEQDTTPTPAPEQDTTPTPAPEQDTTPAPEQDTIPTSAPEQDTTPTAAQNTT